MRDRRRKYSSRLGRPRHCCQHARKAQERQASARVWLGMNDLYDRYLIQALHCKNKEYI